MMLKVMCGGNKPFRKRSTKVVYGRKKVFFTVVKRNLLMLTYSALQLQQGTKINNCPFCFTTDCGVGASFRENSLRRTKALTFRILRRTNFTFERIKSEGRNNTFAPKRNNNALCCRTYIYHIVSKNHIF